MGPGSVPRPAASPPPPPAAPPPPPPLAPAPRPCQVTGALIAAALRTRSRVQRAERVAGVEVFSLGRPELPLHLDVLCIARGEVVEHRVAEDVLERLRGGDIAAAAPDDHADLELVVDDAGVRGPVNLGIVTDDA